MDIINFRDNNKLSHCLPTKTDELILDKGNFRFEYVSNIIKQSIRCN